MTNLSDNSHQLVTCECDFKLSPKCVLNKMLRHRDAVANRKRNNGRYICFHCSRALKGRGRKGSGAKYNTDDGMFKIIDSEAKAYLLGWIASDGSFHRTGSIAIIIHKKDVDVLYRIKQALNFDVPIFRSGKDMVGIRLCSKELTDDAGRLLGVDTSAKSLKKDAIVKMPKLSSDDLQWAFIRGYFDGDGSISSPSYDKRSPYADITSYSPFIKQGVKDFCGIPCTIDDYRIYWSGNNALDFLEKLYKNAKVYLSRKADLYAIWSTWTPAVLKGEWARGWNKQFKWAKTRPDACPPSKARASDSGYDITILGVHKRVGDVTFYSTGIKVTPAYGYYFDMVPRSSISKTGYMLANSVGIIDRTYVGEVIVPLRKIDQTAPDLELPCRMVQIVPRHIINVEFQLVDSLEDTTRKEGGFGSTGV